MVLEPLASPDMASTLPATVNGNVGWEKDTAVLSGTRSRRQPSSTPTADELDASSETPSAALEPLIDNRYRIIDKLGEGSMGAVYLAEDLGLGRFVALKIIAEGQARHPRAVERFRKEARALAQVRDDNVVQIYAFGCDEQSYFFAMEYVAGKNLDVVMEEYAKRGETMPLSAAMDVARNVARGLSAVHRRGLVHRDIKPNNIVLEDGTGRPVLVDFGLAREHDSFKAALACGTPLYMSPEQILDIDGSTTTARSDLYSLGCTLFELFTGAPVFSGNDVNELLDQHLSAVPPTLSSRRPELLPLDGVIGKLLAKNAAERYPNCEAFVANFEEAVGTMPESSQRLSMRVRMTSSLPPAAMGRSVLIIDDDEDARRSMFHAAERAFAAHGCVVRLLLAASGPESLLLFEQNLPDIVVLDCEMPMLDGAQTLSMLRLLPGGRDAQVLAVKARENAVARLAKLGVADFIPNLSEEDLSFKLGVMATRAGWT
ncbi:MAG: protein kinase [Polyangiaceae bacterium]|nr:protein kinase [Polyangiaceae bacterium]